MRFFLIIALIAGIAAGVTIGGHAGLVALADTETALAQPARATCGLCHGPGLSYEDTNETARR